MRIVSHTTLVVGKGEYLPPGTPVDLEDAEAEALIARGLAHPANAAAPQPAAPAVTVEKSGPGATITRTMDTPPATAADGASTDGAAD